MQPDAPANLTLEEHRELARELRATRARVKELSNLVAAIYGRGNGAAASFLKAAEAVDRLCQEMQEQALHDLPGFHIDGLYR